jgi:serine/threonine protein kinase
LIEDLANRVQAGEQIDLEAVIAAHPMYAEQLRRLMPAVEVLAELGHSASAAGSAPAPMGSDGEPASGILGDFRIIREVGRGGMGVVYEAEQVSLGRRVALKVLPFAATMDARQLQRFHNEARAAASLHHEHIVPVYSVGQERAVHFYAMQFIDGQTLAEFITRRKGVAPADTVDRSHAANEPSVAPPSPAAKTATAAAATAPAPRSAADYRAVAEWMAQAAEALEHAHALGIVHRDIKPGNLMLDAQGKLWVTDFGLARTGTDAGLTMTGDLVGTLRYMSPEQALAKHGLVDHRTDVYSLGATLYELLTLQPAIDGKDREEVLRNIAFEEPRRPRQIDRGIPADLETITLKALAKEPGERYTAARELADDLRRWREDKPIQARRPGLVARAQKWSRRHRAIVRAMGVGFFVAVVALAASTVWALHKQKQTEEAGQLADRQRVAAENNAAEADKQRQQATENFRKSVKVVTALLENMSGNRDGLNQERVNLASEAALVIQELLAGYTPTEPEGRLLIAQAHEGLGTADVIRGELFEAARHYVEARDLCAQLATEFPEDDRYQHEKVRIRERLRELRPFVQAQLAAESGLHEVAARAFRDSIRINQIAGTEIEGHMTLQDQAICHMRLAEALRALGQRPEAERAYGEALADCDRLAQYPAIKVWPPLLMAHRARALAGRGILEAQGGQLERAEADFRQALDLVDGLKPDEQVILVGVLHDRAQVRSALGNVLWARGQREKATEQFRRAEKEWREAKSNPVRDNDLAWFLATCPDTQFCDAKEAVRLAQQAVKGTPEMAPWRTFGVTDSNPWHYRRTLAVALYRAGDWMGAAETLQAVAKLRNRHYRAILTRPDASRALENEVKLQREWEDDSIADTFFLAMTRWQLKNKERARSAYDSAAGIMEHHRPGDEELRRFCEEAAHLLGIKDQPPQE